eukprot:2077478-Pleurochrysis_carterae.AAC.1
MPAFCGTCMVWALHARHSEELGEEESSLLQPESKLILYLLFESHFVRSATRRSATRTKDTRAG